MPKTSSIRILVVPPGKSPEVKVVDNSSWRTWYPLVDKSTELLQTLRILPGIDMLFDEEGRLKNMPPNVLVPAYAPAAPPKGTVIIDTTGGKGMKPGEPGIGYHEILGTFLVARVHGSRYVDLKDEDIEIFKAYLARG